RAGRSNSPARLRPRPPLGPALRTMSPARGRSRASGSSERSSRRPPTRSSPRAQTHRPPPSRPLRRSDRDRQEMGADADEQRVLFDETRGPQVELAVDAVAPPEQPSGALDAVDRTDHEPRGDELVLQLV